MMSSQLFFREREEEKCYNRIARVHHRCLRKATPRCMRTFQNVCREDACRELTDS